MSREYTPHFSRSVKSSKMVSGERPLSVLQNFPLFIVVFNMARILFMDRFTIQISIYKGLSMSSHFVQNILNMLFHFFFRMLKHIYCSMRTINTSIPLLCQIKFKNVHEHSRTVYLLDMQGSVVHV